MSGNPKLSPQERTAFRMLCKDFSYTHIAGLMGIRVDNLHTICHHIRQKTGIRDTRDPEQCRAYARLPEPLSFRPPLKITAHQLEVLKLIAQGLTYREIAGQLSIALQSVQNHAVRGCKRLGITGQGHGRTAAIVNYFATGQLHQGRTEQAAPSDAKPTRVSYTMDDF